MRTPCSRSLLPAALSLSLLLALGVRAAEFVFPPHTLTVPDGYAVERIAAAPLVERPIHLAFDEEGVLYVTDSSGNSKPATVQLANPSHRIRRLVDRDGDGVFDESILFADRLPFPEGILIHEGAIYVTAPPHIWKLRDTDGDHVADEREVWFDGGSIEPCGNDLHGPYLAPDGFFYWTKGAFRKQSHRLGDGRLFSSSAAHVYRAKPDGSQLEVILTGGMNNPVGLAFSEAGERFLSGTFFDLSRPGRRDGILHAVYGGTYGRRHDRVLAEHPRTGDLLPLLQQLGPSASSGMIMARHGALGLRGDLLCADFNLRRIARHQLARSGSSYRAELSTLLESDQTDFHPTDVIEDADGSLLIADTGSWYQICCPTSKISKPHILGAIYRLKREGASAAKDPRGLALDWARPEIDWLSDERPAVVRRAIDALASEDHLAALRSAAARLPALWALHRIPGAAARAAVRGCLDEADPDLRAAAVHSIALWRDPAAADGLEELLSADDLRLCRLAAMALGRLGDRRAVGALLAAASGRLDPFLQHALTYALYEIAAGGTLPGDHAILEQVRRMQEVDRRNPSAQILPAIEAPEVAHLEPGERARQEARLAELARYLPEGDPERGAVLFRDAERTRCITCHVRGPEGVSFGPDLTRIGAIRSERDLLEAIVYPSSSIARYYELVTVHQKRGLVDGLIVRDGVDQLVLASAPGEERAVPIRDIRRAQYSNLSLMPEGLDGILEPRDLADLVAFLQEDPGPALVSRELIPPHQAIELPGLHAYAQKSIAAGEEIELRVSSRVPYELSIVKLGADPDERDGDPVLERLRVEKPRSQPVHPGSYLHVAKSLPARRLPALTLECWIRPFTLSGWQGLLTQHDYPERSGIGLFLNGGRLVFLTGAGGEFEAASLHESATGSVEAQRWQHVVATWDGKRKRIYLDGRRVLDVPFVGVVRPGETPLRIGAYGSEGVAASFFNGDLAQSAIYERALGPAEIAERVADRGRTAPKGEALLASWAFQEERGEEVADASPHGRRARIVNRGTWMVGGPSFDAAAIARHDRSYDPTEDPDRGHGLRLASDELYNARWEVSHRFRIAADAASGVYAGRFDFELNGEPRRYFVTFVVKRPASRPRAPLLVLVSSNTWLAYNSVPFPVNHGRGLINLGTGGLANSHPGAPTYSCYSDHRNGQPTYKVGMKVPWPAAGPNKSYIGRGYGHLLRGERFLHLWLDKKGYAYDVLTDHDLDRDPGVLEGYQAVILNGHSEYWSVPAYEGLDKYLEAGGAAVVMSGNTMFWRVSFDDTGEVMECRKFGTQIGGRRLARVGELYHSHDFERGSLMRFCGYPAWKLVGLTCIGWSGIDFKPYRVDLEDHFLFQRPHKIELAKGQAFGFVAKGLGAVGHEYDVRLSTLLRATKKPVIEGLEEPAGIVTLARSHAKRAVLDFNAEGHRPRVGGEETIAEIIYWERPRGGRVFHTGSIGTAWGMYHDESLSRLVENVLHHFNVRPK